MSWERGAGRGARGPGPPGLLCSLRPPPWGQRMDSATFCLPRWGLGHSCCQRVSWEGQGSSSPAHVPAGG